MLQHQGQQKKRSEGMENMENYAKAGVNLSEKWERLTYPRIGCNHLFRELGKDILTKLSDYWVV